MTDSPIRKERPTVEELRRWCEATPCLHTGPCDPLWCSRAALRAALDLLAEAQRDTARLDYLDRADPTSIDRGDELKWVIEMPDGSWCEYDDLRAAIDAARLATQLRALYGGETR